MLISYTLPESATLSVKPKSKIKFGDVLGLVGSSEHITIHLSENLKIRPNQIFKYMIKIIGEEVNVGDVIAEKKSGLFSKKFISDHLGVLKEINHQTGDIMLEVVSQEEENILAPFNGDVDEILGNVLKVRIEQGTAHPLKEASGDGGGELFYFDQESSYFSITEDEIENKIICMKDIKKHIASKCEALGAAGFIYLKGEVDSTLPCAILKTPDDYQAIHKLHNKYALFSMDDRKVVVYD